MLYFYAFQSITREEGKNPKENNDNSKPSLNASVTSA